MKKSSLTATIELTCVDLPEEPDEDEVERTEETLAMWRRAKKIADRFGVRTNFRSTVIAGLSTAMPMYILRLTYSRMCSTPSIAVRSTTTTSTSRMGRRRNSL